MPAKRLVILDGGTIDLDKGSLVLDPLLGQKTGKIVTVPVWQIYVEHEEGKVVVDTGFNCEMDYKEFNARQTDEQRIDSQLAKIGIRTEDIDFVINTHLHTDHSGYQRLFKNSVFLVQDEEIRHAKHPSRWPIAYDRSLYDLPELHYESVFGDREVFDGLMVLSTPGHSPGHQSVYVETEKGKRILFAGDACYLMENLGPPLRLSGMFFNPTDYFTSLEKIRKFAGDKKASIWPSHDPTFFNEEVKKAPFSYT